MDLVASTAKDRAGKLLYMGNEFGYYGLKIKKRFTQNKRDMKIVWTY